MKLMLEWTKLTWWYWLLSVLALTVGLAGNPDGFYLLMVLCFIQLVHFGILDKTFESFTVQLRVVMLGMVILFYWEPLRFLYWIPFFGLWANVLFGYCLLARIMVLMPWNRKEPLTRNLIKRTIFSSPVRGCILDANKTAASGQ